MADMAMTDEPLLNGTSPVNTCTNGELSHSTQPLFPQRASTMTIAKANMSAALLCVPLSITSGAAHRTVWPC